MDIQQAKAEVSSALVEIAEQLETVLNRKGQIPQIELDLLLTNTQRLYSFLVVLSKLNTGIKPDGLDKGKTPEVPIVKQEEIARMVQSEVGKLRDEMFRTLTSPNKGNDPAPVTEPAISPIPFTPTPTPKPQTGPSPEKLAKIKENPFIGKTVMPNGLVEEKHTETLVETPPVEVVEEKTPVAPPVENTIITEVKVTEAMPEATTIQPTTTPLDVTLPPLTQPTALFTEATATPATDNSVANRLRGKAITNIKSAIGINDKFQYLNDLFYGNVQDYNESLDALNNFGTFEQAEAHFNSLRNKFSWDMENNSATGLFELVIRRYMK